MRWNFLFCVIVFLLVGYALPIFNCFHYYLGLSSVRPIKTKTFGCIKLKSCKKICWPSVVAYACNPPIWRLEMVDRTVEHISITIRYRLVLDTFNEVKIFKKSQNNVGYWVLPISDLCRKKIWICSAKHSSYRSICLYQVWYRCLFGVCLFVVLFVVAYSSHSSETMRLMYIVYASGTYHNFFNSSPPRSL